MKKVIIILTVCAVIAGLSACVTTKTCRCRCATIPNNLKPISCEDWNDVATVYWNMVNDCNNDIDRSYLCGTDTMLFVGNPVLLIEGWGRKSGNYIILCPDSISAASEYVEIASNSVNLYLNWPVSGGIVADNSVDYYHILCYQIQQFGVGGGYPPTRYRIELGGWLFIPENYENKKGGEK